jgi:hypothetical protein
MIGTLTNRERQNVKEAMGIGLAEPSGIQGRQARRGEARSEALHEPRAEGGDEGRP